MNKSLRRRRLENKTDYKARLALLKSGKPRLVVRRTNRYLIAQIVESDLSQDKVLFGVSSKDLLSKGWPNELSGSLKSIPASYLTGLLIGKLARAKVKSLVLDMGMHRNIKKSRIYALLKGVFDSGIDIPADKDIFPEISSSLNEKTKKVFEKLSKEI